MVRLAVLLTCQTYWVQEAPFRVALVSSPLVLFVCQDGDAEAIPKNQKKDWVAMSEKIDMHDTILFHTPSVCVVTIGNENNRINKRNKTQERFHISGSCG